MGYQVGATCYTDKQLAENVYFSQAVPQITVDGVKQVEYRKDGWYYGSQKVEVKLPECDPAANYKAGFELGMELLPTAVLLMSSALVIRLLK